MARPMIAEPQLVILPLTLEVGHYALWSSGEKFPFWCHTRKSYKASRYLEVGRINMKSGWHWVQNRILPHAGAVWIKGPSIY